MNQQPIIAKVYHNRCVLLDPMQMARAGIAKDDQVTLRVNGDAIVIRKAHVVDTELQDQALLDYLASFIRTMSPDQIGMLKQAICLQVEE